MPSPSRLLSVSLLALLAFAMGCREEQPAAKVTAGLPSAPASGTASASSAPPAVTVAAAPPLRKPSAPAPPLRKPTALDAAGLRAAKLYLAELGRGRKATLAKDFAQADEHFSKCLEVLPSDARALAERGYARLLASKLSEAEADLAAAARSAPSSAVLVQILHNQMLVARQRGDEEAATRFEAEKKKLKAARRLPNGVTCSSDLTDSELKPQAAQSLDDAFKVLVAAHAAEDNTAPSAVQIVEGPLGEPNEAEPLKALAAQGPLPEGSWQLWSQGKSGMSHVLISHAGKLHAFPNLSPVSMSLCGLDGSAEVKVGGGGTQPWYIQRTYRQMARGYLCEKPNNAAGPCGDADDVREMNMGFCAWASTNIDVTILDSKTFEGIRTLRVSAQPSDGSADEPEHLLELEWQADKVVVDACAQRTVVPYAPE
jgi:tetratricopeptide (TPR) repeat protein